MRSPVHFLFLAAAASLSACASSPVQPRIWQTVTLGPSHRTLAARVRIGDGLRVVLPRPQGGDGFNWQIVSNSDDVLRQLTPVYPTQGAPAPGPDGGLTVAFSAVDEGASVLRFAALRPNAKLSEATDFYEVDVTSKP